MPLQVKSASSWWTTIACALAPVLAILPTHPVAETGIADDWSYTRSAEILARTGHVVYNGWSTAMLGWQLYWGALFIRLFGATWTVERTSVLLLSVVCSVVLFRLLLRCGISVLHTTLVVLTLTLSPVFLPLSFSFMSDTPGLLAMLVCMYGTLRALQATSERAALAWLLFAAASNLVLGTARQICWLGLIVLVPTAILLLWRNRLVRWWGTGAWVVLLGIMAGALHWFEQQDYSLPEHLLHGRPHHWELVHLANSIADLLLGFPLLMLPLWLPMLAHVPWRKRKVRWSAAAVFLLATSTGIWMAHHHTLLRWLQPTLGVVLSRYGAWDTPFGPVSRVVILTPTIRLVLSVASLAGTFAFLAVAAGSSAERKGSDDARRWQTTLLLFGPFTVSYLLLLMPRAMYGILYDRYLLILVALAGLYTMHLWQRAGSTRMPAAAAALLAIVAAYSVATTHDLFAIYRARLIAIENLERSGIPRTQLRGELEYDSTTEIDVAGHLNEPRIVQPAGGYRKVPNARYSLDSYAPHVHPEYEFVLNDPTVGGMTDLPPVPFTQWLGQHRQVFYTRRGNGGESLTGALDRYH